VAGEGRALWTSCVDASHSVRTASRSQRSCSQCFVHPPCPPSPPCYTNTTHQQACEGLADARYSTRSRLDVEIENHTVNPSAGLIPTQCWVVERSGGRVGCTMQVGQRRGARTAVGGALTAMRANLAALWVVVTAALGASFVRGSTTTIKVTDQCESGSYLDISGLECSACGTNEEVTADGLSCQCTLGTIRVVSPPSLQPTSLAESAGGDGFTECSRCDFSIPVRDSAMAKPNVHSLEYHSSAAPKGAGCSQHSPRPPRLSLAALLQLRREGGKTLRVT
jgi:hypothetical protein